jgi:hypothetical protein
LSRRMLTVHLRIGSGIVADLRYHNLRDADANRHMKELKRHSKVEQ